MEVDKVFIINLPYRTDRKGAILKELRRMRIHNFEFFDGILIPSRRHLLKINPSFLKERPSWLKDRGEAYFQQYRLGALGCLLSHLGVMRRALTRGYNKILILEDDAGFIADRGSWLHMCAAYRRQYTGPDPPYDILYLGGSHFERQLKRLSENLFLTKHSGGGYGYIINRETMKYVVKNALAFGREIDIFYIANIQPRGKCFCILPSVVYQADGFSDICQEKQFYENTGVTGVGPIDIKSVSSKIATIDVQKKAAIVRDDFKEVRRLRIVKAVAQKEKALAEKQAATAIAAAAQKAAVAAANAARAAAKKAEAARATAAAAADKERATVIATREEEAKLEADKAEITNLLSKLGWKFSSKQLQAAKRQASPYS